MHALKGDQRAIRAEKNEAYKDMWAKQLVPKRVQVEKERADERYEDLPEKLSELERAEKNKCRR